MEPLLEANHTFPSPWKKELFEYLIDKKVMAFQDINYHNLKLILPEQTPASIRSVLYPAIVNLPKKSLILWQHLKEILPDLKNAKESEKIKEHREKIIDIYERVKNE